MLLKELEEKLYKLYDKETCYPKCKNEWHKDNPYIGQCAVTSLIVNDLFKGAIYKIKVKDMSHYFNYINGEIIDLTAGQFNEKINYNQKELANRKEMLNADLEMRYKKLKDRLKDGEIWQNQQLKQN
jgi:hypothetical protein